LGKPRGGHPNVASKKKRTRFLGFNSTGHDGRGLSEMKKRPTKSTYV